MANYYNNLTSSGLTLAKNGLTTSSADTVLLNDKATFDFDDFELSNITGPLPKWSEVATATSGDIVIPDCVVDVSGFNVKYKESPIKSFKTGLLYSCNRVTDMAGMFYNCSILTSLDLSNFDTSRVTDMNLMFYGCINLPSLNVSNFNTSKVVDMSRMFYECVKLTSLNVSNFNTSKVVDMSHMFHGCIKLTSLDLSNFDTSNVGDMNRMFYNCSKLASLNLSNFNTSKVHNMNRMFRDCTSLTSLNLSNFDTSKVTDMSQMFYNCSSLTSLDLSSFTSKADNISDMFYRCSALTTLILGPGWGHGLINQSNSAYRTLDLSTTAITKEVANDVLSKLDDVSLFYTYMPIVKFKSSLGLSSTEIAVGTRKSWDVQLV